MEFQTKLIKTFILFSFLIFLTAVNCENDKQNEKMFKINCRKYVYAPKCRGVGAKRDINERRRSFDDEPSFRHTEDMDSDAFASEFPEYPRKQWNFKNIDTSILLRALLQRAKEMEYDTGTRPYY